MIRKKRRFTIIRDVNRNWPWRHWKKSPTSMKVLQTPSFDWNNWFRLFSENCSPIEERGHNIVNQNVNFRPRGLIKIFVKVGLGYYTWTQQKVCLPLFIVDIVLLMPRRQLHIVTFFLHLFFLFRNVILIGIQSVRVITLIHSVPISVSLFLIGFIFPKIGLAPTHPSRFWAIFRP